MSILHLIRHGQASFGADDYDNLSPKGIEQSIAKKITADVKSSKIKVQIKINGNELRVDGKKKDDLQSVMQMIEGLNVGIPIQFVNFRD